MRYLRVVAAALALLAVGAAAGQKSASATSYDSEERQFLQLINQYRAENGLGKLLLSDTLSESSERHSQDMARYNFFAHNTVASSYYPVGSAPWDRMRAEGYNYPTFWGENIAVGCESAERCFQLWRNSPEHNEAMLNGNYHEIGIARVIVPGSRWYWTTDFGGAVDPTAHAPGETPQPQETSGPPAQHEEVVQDGPRIENSAMDSDEVWEQKARDEAELILDGHARLGDYDDGVDDLSQKVRVGQNAQLAYRLRIESSEPRDTFDRLEVRLVDAEGRQIAVLDEYGADDAGGWRRERVNLSRFAGKTVYLSFHVETNHAGLTAFYLDDVSLEGAKVQP